MKTVLSSDVSPDTSDSVIRPNREYNFNENLIECNSQLVSRIQGHESAKLKHGPGHFIQKVLLQKLKSKSVPVLVKNNDSSEAVDLSQSHQEENHEDVNCTENWFKTWPDCVDKIKEPDKDEENQCDPSEPNGNVSSAIANGNDHPSQNDNVVKNENKDNIDNCDKNVHTPTSLDNALQDLPIAYSPLTKQILIVNTERRHENCQSSVPSPKPNRATLHRVATEAGSFSSTVSSLSDYSPLAGEEVSPSSAFFENGDSCSLISIGTCSIGSQGSIGDKPKRRGLTGFFSRGVFGWKGKAESSNNQGQEGWSLFGKSVISRSLTALPRDNYSDEQGSVGSDSVQGSSGLIPLERPEGLPEKSIEERQAHASQHDSIIRSARKKELKEAKERKKNLQNQLKTEDELANATRVWIHDILPKWFQVKNTKKTLEMWWLGIPPGVRGKVWKLAISNDLNLTRELYDICVTRAKEKLNGNKILKDSSRDGLDRESSLDLIQLDISRTFPNLCIFQKGGPYYCMLHDLLAAYVCYRPDIGYVQGMSFIAAVLILNMDVADAFVCFANILNRPCHRAFYSLDTPMMEAYYAAYHELLKENQPRLWAHLESTKLTPDLYLMDWIYTIYAKAMNLDLASRVWDLFLRDGDDFLFRTAIGILVVSETVLMKSDFLAGSQHLIRLPEDLSPASLFKAVSQVKMTSNKRTFTQILSAYLPKS